MRTTGMPSISRGSSSRPPCSSQVGLFAFAKRDDDPVRPVLSNRVEHDLIGRVGLDVHVGRLARGGSSYRFAHLAGVRARGALVVREPLKARLLDCWHDDVELIVRGNDLGEDAAIELGAGDDHDACHVTSIPARAPAQTVRASRGMGITDAWLGAVGGDDWGERVFAT